jgi:hypothetical protein
MGSSTSEYQLIQSSIGDNLHVGSNLSCLETINSNEFTHDLDVPHSILLFHSLHLQQSCHGSRTGWPLTPFRISRYLAIRRSTHCLFRVLVGRLHSPLQVIGGRYVSYSREPACGSGTDLDLVAILYSPFAFAFGIAFVRFDRNVSFACLVSLDGKLDSPSSSRMYRSPPHAT